jgi:DNA-binding beta-propeller fold protein YncE
VVTILATQEFAVYERTGISVLATEIRTVFETGAFSWAGVNITTVSAGTAATAAGPAQSARAAAAIATALPMLVIVIALAAVAVYLPARLSAVDALESAPAWPRALDTRTRPKLLACLVLLVTLALPVFALLASISSHRWHTDPDGHAWPTRIWLWASPYITGSLSTALVTGVFAVLIATLATTRHSGLLLAIALLTFLIGGELLAIADIRIYNHPRPRLLSLIYNNMPVMVIAYLGRFAWLPLLAGLTAHSRALRDLRDMAALDGATPWRSTTRVIWPVLWPILLASGVLVVILSLTEVGATVLLSPLRPPMFVPTLMRWVHMLRYDDMLEGSLLLIALVTGLGAVFLLFLRFGVRLTRLVASPKVRVVSILLSLLVLAGCDDGTQPRAVWMETGTELGQVAYPRGIAYSKRDDCFYVVDRSGRIQRVEQGGKVTLQWNLPETKNGFPVGLTVGPDNNLYVADTHYYRVLIYSPRGQLLRQFGSNGTGPGQFTYPMDVAFDSKGEIYVCETGGNDRIQVFTPQGTFIRQISKLGSEDGEMSRPVGMLIDDKDLIYVADASNHRIEVFKTDGTFIRRFGGVGSNLGQVRFPYGLAWDSHGRLVVAEFGNNRVQIFDKDTGQGIRTWGLAGREPGQLAYPWAVEVDKDDNIVVVDSGNNRLQVFK